MTKIYSTNFLNLPDRNDNTNFTIIFMEEKATQFQKVSLLIPSYKRVKHLYEFLLGAKANPFRSFFLTNKIKEKPQFTDDKYLWELKEECKKDKDDHFVLLCYEDKKKGG